MKSTFLLVSLLSLLLHNHSALSANSDDDFENDFAEFDFEEESDDDFIDPSAAKSPQDTAQDEDDGVVEDEDSEFENFDEEEFEGFTPGGASDDSDEPLPKTGDQKKTAAGEPKLTPAKVPIHFRTHWDSYHLEMLMLAGLLVYFANYFVGRGKNSKIANLWLAKHRQLLEDNFVLVGDDGRKEGDPFSGFVKESESVYTLWCSGRTCCEGMLVELKLIKRQDLVSIIAGIMRPVVDQVHVRVEISRDSMDTFVFCVGSRKTVTRAFKELSDLAKFCTLVNRPEDKYNMPAGFSVLSEIPEATAMLLDSKLLAALNKYGHLIDYIQISDQFCGPLQQEDPAQLKQPEVQRVLLAGFNVADDMDEMKPLLILVFYLMERLKRFKLSRESKVKAEKNRARVEEAFLKTTHAARAEAAALKREEKRKQEKEKILAEDDPEKQRRWEKKEQKRQLKKQAPKMKQLSIKAL